MPYYGLATKAQAVILRAAGTTYTKISSIAGITIKHVKNLYNEATARGWNPLSPLLNYHVQEKPRSGAPKKITPEKELEIISAITRDCYGREKSFQALAIQCGVSP